MTTIGTKTESAHRVRGRIGIRSALLLAVDAVMLLGLAILLGIDYQWELGARLREKQVAMTEEAALVLVTVQMLQNQGKEAIQSYVDQACAQMQEGVSPGHHIAVRIGGSVIQARTHHRASPAFAHAMQLADLTADHTAEVQGDTILVGSRGNDSVHAYVSEFSSNIRKAVRWQLLSRAGGLAVVGLAVTAIVNLVIVRLVTHPIDRLVRTVRQIGHGRFGVIPQGFSIAELDFLSEEIGQMSRSLAETDLYRKRQMDKASRIQQRLLPAPDHLKSTGIHFVHQPADEVGGDFFDVKVVDEQRLVMGIGDVTGHGVPAAMSAGMLKMLFQETCDGFSTPAGVLKEINRRFHSITLDEDFATILIAVIDRSEGQLRYASAGHEYGYVVHAGGTLVKLASTGTLLGIAPDTECGVVEVAIEAGDTIVFLTDGLVETIAPDGSILGRRVIQQVLIESGHRPSHDIASELLRIARSHRGDSAQCDDITVTIIKV
ncbi:MAG: HAMP domain-containing protein [Planctomycetes bacterium]|nr:HAMP domain-containing protein [Planctomycetota bacterium]NOG53136.1 SpoIIE family protein phosphatase [Planctomycetota bacterium]